MTKVNKTVASCGSGLVILRMMSFSTLELFTMSRSMREKKGEFVNPRTLAARRSTAKRETMVKSVERRAFRNRAQFMERGRELDGTGKEERVKGTKVAG